MKKNQKKEKKQEQEKLPTFPICNGRIIVDRIHTNSFCDSMDDDENKKKLLASLKHLDGTKNVTFDGYQFDIPIKTIQELLINVERIRFVRLYMNDTYILDSIQPMKNIVKIMFVIDCRFNFDELKQRNGDMLALTTKLYANGTKMVFVLKKLIGNDNEYTFFKQLLESLKIDIKIKTETYKEVKVGKTTSYYNKII